MSGAGGAYQGAMEAVLAVVVATGIGYWADSHYGTEPLWLIVGAVVGFASMVVRLLRMAKLIEDPSFGGRGKPDRDDEHGRDEDESGEAAARGREKKGGESGD